MWVYICCYDCWLFHNNTTGKCFDPGISHAFDSKQLHTFQQHFGHTAFYPSTQYMDYATAETKNNYVMEATLVLLVMDRIGGLVVLNTTASVYKVLLLGLLFHTHLPPCHKVHYSQSRGLLYRTHTILIQAQKFVISCSPSI